VSLGHVSAMMVGPMTIIEFSLSFDPVGLAAEVAALPADSWRRDPLDRRCSFVPVVHRRGDHTDDSLEAPFRPTTWAGDLPASMALVAGLGVPVGTARLVRRPAGSVVRRLDPYWFDHHVVLLPVAGADDAVVTTGGASAHLVPGRAVLIDPLVPIGISGADDVVMFEVAVRAPLVGSDGQVAESVLMTELVGAPGVPGPELLAARVERLIGALPDLVDAEEVRSVAERFLARWRSVCAVQGTAALSPLHLAAREELSVWTESLEGSDVPDSDMSVAEMLMAALAEELPARAGADRDLVTDPRFERPVFVVGTPRSGSRRLALAIAAGDGTYSTESSILGMVGRRSTAPLESDRLTAEQATERLAGRFRDEVFDAVVDRHGSPAPMNAAGLRLIDGGSRAALSIELLDQVFPNARYVFVTRDPRVEIGEMAGVWESGNSVSHPDLPDWSGPPWTFELIPGWRDLNGASVAEICAHQWATITDGVIDDLDRVAPGRWTSVDHDRLVTTPGRELRRILRFVGLDPDVDQQRTAALARHEFLGNGRRLTDEEWAVVESVVADVAVRAARVSDVRPAQSVQQVRRRGGAGLAELLGLSSSALLVAGRGAGGVTVLQAADGVLDVDHVSVGGARAVAHAPLAGLSVATRSDVWTFRNQPGRAANLNSANSIGFLFVQRSSHHTGAAGVRELAHDADGALWMVSSEYSCLATLDSEHSLVPRWVPGFVGRVSDGDLCHLNGLAMRDGKPGFVTALSDSDQRGGWRDTQTFGGVVVDVEQDEVIARGLCLPHSPRWYQDRLWLLEAGSGSLGWVDTESGRFEVVAELPGFARGLTFVGRYAVVGTSRLRPSTVAGVPLATSGRALRTGISIVDIERGELVGGVSLDEELREIFDVHAVGTPGRRVQAGPAAEVAERSVVVPSLDRQIGS
jgi:uncharacterized protein (TIGR03032 family)